MTFLPEKFKPKTKNFFFDCDYKTCWIRRGFEQLSSSIAWRVIGFQSSAKKVAHAGLKGFWHCHNHNKVQYCCDRKFRAACAQSCAPWQQATIEITRRDHSVIACSRHIHIFLFFAPIPFVVNHTINATPPERLQQHPLIFTTNHTDRTFFVWRLDSARPPHPGHSTILLTCLSLRNTQARAVNLIHAVLCDDEGVRGC